MNSISQDVYGIYIYNIVIAWQKSRPWLIMNAETGLVQCKTCAEIKRLGLHTERGQHHEPAFVCGTVVAKSAKAF